MLDLPTLRIRPREITRYATHGVAAVTMKGYGHRPHVIDVSDLVKTNLPRWMWAKKSSIIIGTEEVSHPEEALRVDGDALKGVLVTARSIEMMAVASSVVRAHPQAGSLEYIGTNLFVAYPIYHLDDD